MTEPVPKSLGRVDSQRSKEVRFASATIIVGSVIIVLNIVCLFVAWIDIEFGGVAPAASAPPSNRTQVVSDMLDPFAFNSSEARMKLSFGIISEMSGSVSTSSGSRSFAANFRTQTQHSGVTLQDTFIGMCGSFEIDSSNILHTNAFAVWLHYSLCHVQPTILMPLICLSISLTFISVLSWSLSSWPVPFLDKAMPLWRDALGMVLGRAVGLYKCAFMSAAALGLSVGADVIFSILINNNYSVFLKKYADSQSLKSSDFVHSSANSIGYFISLIASALLLLFSVGQFMMARELGMRDGFAGGSAVRYMDTRPQQPEIELKEVETSDSEPEYGEA